MRSTLVDANLISADAGAKLDVMAADPGLLREKAREVIVALEKIQKEKVTA